MKLMSDVLSGVFINGLDSQERVIRSSLDSCVVVIICYQVVLIRIPYGTSNVILVLSMNGFLKMSMQLILTIEYA